MIEFSSVSAVGGGVDIGIYNYNDTMDTPTTIGLRFLSRYSMRENAAVAQFWQSARLLTEWSEVRVLPAAPSFEINHPWLFEIRIYAIKILRK
jgi:hypothetical protein